MTTKHMFMMLSIILGTLALMAWAAGQFFVLLLTIWMGWQK